MSTTSSESSGATLRALKRQRVRSGGVSFTGRYGLTLFFLAMITVFSIASPTVFFTTPTFVNITQSNSVLALVALGAMMPLVVGEFDLTVGATVGFAAIICSLLDQHGVPFVFSMMLTLGLGVLIGLINSFSINVLRVSSLITTLGLSSIITGFTAFLTGGQTVTAGIPTSLVYFTQLNWFGVPRLVYVVMAVALVAWFVLTYTSVGREFYAVGMNRDSSRLMGSRVKRDIVVAFAISGMLASLAGIFEMGLLQSVNPTVGSDVLLPALAVSFLGASTIRPGWFNVWGTLLGVLVLQTGIVGLDDMGSPYWLQPIFDGAVLIIAVAISAIAFPAMFASFRHFFRRGPTDSAVHLAASED